MNRDFYLLMVPGGRVFRVLAYETTNVWSREFQQGDPVKTLYYPEFVEDVESGFRSYGLKNSRDHTFETRSEAIADGIRIILTDIVEIDAVEEGNDSGTNEAE